MQYVVFGRRCPKAYSGITSSAMQEGGSCKMRALTRRGHPQLRGCHDADREAERERERERAIGDGCL